jgi:hypothetical protein
MHYRRSKIAPFRWLLASGFWLLASGLAAEIYNPLTLPPLLQIVTKPGEGVFLDWDGLGGTTGL